MTIRIKNIFLQLKTTIRTHRMFLRNFLAIILVMTLVFSTFSIYIYHNSRQIIEEEFLNASKQDIENIGAYIDNSIMDIRYVISTLAINDLVEIFFSSDSPEALVERFPVRLMNQIQAFQNGNKAIENIYLYSEDTNMIYTANQRIQFDFFRDTYWLEKLSPNENGFSIFPYAINDIFPYVICIAKQFTVNGHNAIIVVNVSLSKLSVLDEIINSKYQEIYIISDQDEIIFRQKQQSVTEPLNNFELLSAFQTQLSDNAIISSEPDDPYTFVQLHSSDYDWSYVLVTHLQDYTHRLTSSRALLLSLLAVFIFATIFIAIFISLKSIKPIYEIRKFLDDPDILFTGSSDYDEEIKYITGKITQYVQTNKQFADELSQQLQLLNETHLLALQSQINPHFLFNTLNMIYLLESDYLGYEHIVPQMTLNLAKLLRYSLEPAEMVELTKELTYTDIYLSILNQRYGENLKIIHCISPDVLTAKVPKLFIQPVIENAVYHGFSKMHDLECLLTITCQMVENSADHTVPKNVMLSVQDNGIGIKEDVLKQIQSQLQDDTTPSGKSIGLRNVVQRMKLMYSEEIQVRIQSSPEKGTCFTLIFPYIT